MGRFLVFVGLSLVATGVFWMYGEKLGLGHLPGDMTIKSDRYAVYLPITTCILISVVASIVWRILRMIFGGGGGGDDGI